MRRKSKENPRIVARENAERLFRLGKTKQQIEESFIESGFSQEEAKTETEQLFEFQVDSKRRVAFSYIGVGVAALFSAVAVSFKALSSVTSILIVGLLIFGLVEIYIGVKKFIKLSDNKNKEVDLSGVTELVKKAKQK